jgi:hypothetical protein
VSGHKAGKIFAGEHDPNKPNFCGAAAWSSNGSTHLEFGTERACLARNDVLGNCEIEQAISQRLPILAIVSERREKRGFEAAMECAVETR